MNVIGDAALAVGSGEDQALLVPKRDASRISALPDNGTRWGRLGAAGTSVAASQSISPHSAARTSTERPAVRTRNSKASLVGASAVDTP